MTSPALKRRILGIVAQFEGSANGRINTYDGQLLSVGSIHYALLSGSCHAFLARIAQLDAPGFARCLGDAFLAAVRAGRAPLIQWVNLNVTQPSNANRATLSAWQARFTALSRLPAYATADAECAQPYFQTAERTCTRYKLTTERALAWAFDRAVQQGGAIRPDVERAYRACTPLTPEYNVLKALSYGYADSANPRWRSNVLNRALAMSLGGSDNAGVRPNGVTFNLEDAGISYTRPWNSP